MDLSSEEEFEEFTDEAEEDRADTRKKDEEVQQPGFFSTLTPLGLILLFGGTGVIILIVLFALFSGSGKKASTADLDPIKAKLDQLENSLALLEGTEKRLSRLEGRYKGLDRSIKKLNESGRSLNGRLNKLIKKIDRLGKAPRAVQKKPISQANGRYHEVRRGDTLFGIARKYGIAVDELYRLNNLTKNQDIYIGQKILIPPAGSQ